MFWRILLFIILLPVFLLVLKFIFEGGTPMHFDPFSMVVAIVAISVLGGILSEILKTRKDFNTSSQKELVEIKQHIAKIEADIADIKEQIADFIIKTN